MTEYEYVIPACLTLRDLKVEAGLYKSYSKYAITSVCSKNAFNVPIPLLYMIGNVGNLDSIEVVDVIDVDVILSWKVGKKLLNQIKTSACRFHCL